MPSGCHRDVSVAADVRDSCDDALDESVKVFGAIAPFTKVRVAIAWSSTSAVHEV
jgi:hypothetical protein